VRKEFLVAVTQFSLAGIVFGFLCVVPGSMVSYELTSEIIFRLVMIFLLTVALSGVPRKSSGYMATMKYCGILAAAYSLLLGLRFQRPDVSGVGSNLPGILLIPAAMVFLLFYARNTIMDLVRVASFLLPLTLMYWDYGTVINGNFMPAVPLGEMVAAILGWATQALAVAYLICLALPKPRPEFSIVKFVFRNGFGRS